MKKKKSFMEALEGEVINEAGNYVKRKVTSRAVRIGEMSAAFLIGFVLLIIGVAELLPSVFPILEDGYNYIILGILFLIIGMVLK